MRVYVISSKSKNGGVKADAIFREIVCLIEFSFFSIVEKLAWNPLLLHIADIEPETASAMYIEDQKEADFKQAKWKFDVICLVHIRDNSSESKHSEKLEHREKDELLRKVFVEEDKEYELEGDTCKEIDPKAALDVVHCNFPWFGNFVACENVLIGGSEVKKDVYEE